MAGTKVGGHGLNVVELAVDWLTTHPAEIEAATAAAAAPAAGTAGAEASPEDVSAEEQQLAAVLQPLKAATAAAPAAGAALVRPAWCWKGGAGVSCCSQALQTSCTAVDFLREKRKAHAFRSALPSSMQEPPRRWCLGSLMCWPDQVSAVQAAGAAPAAATARVPPPQQLVEIAIDVAMRQPEAAFPVAELLATQVAPPLHTWMWLRGGQCRLQQWCMVWPCESAWRAGCALADGQPGARVVWHVLLRFLECNALLEFGRQVTTFIGKRQASR